MVRLVDVIPLDPAGAIKALNAYSTALGNIPGAMAGRRVTELRDAFLRVVDDAESSLCHVVDEAGLLRLLHTDRYWQIHRIGDGNARPFDVVNAEIRFQKRRADDLATRFSDMASQNQPGSDTAVRVVLDTNVFLHYRGYNEIDWVAELKEPVVRLVCSIVTVRERRQEERRPKVRRARRELP